MAINPINYAMVQRTNDVGIVKHNEDSRPIINQQNIQVQVEKRQEAQRRQVKDKADSERAKNDDDARDEGKNRYVAGKGQRKNSKKDQASVDADRVVRKQGSGGFDISI